MEIGGNDVHFHIPMDNRRLAVILSYIALVWPDSVIGRDVGDPASNDTVPCLLFVHANAEIARTCDEHGVIPEVEGLLVSLHVQADGIDFVVGAEDGCPGEFLMEGIIATLEVIDALPRSLSRTGV